jgi:hypothetical protein
MPPTKKEALMFQKIRNTTPKSERRLTSEEKRGFQHFKNQKHTLRRKWSKLNTSLQCFKNKKHNP